MQYPEAPDALFGNVAKVLGAGCKRPNKRFNVLSETRQGGRTTMEGTYRAIQQSNEKSIKIASCSTYFNTVQGVSQQFLAGLQDKHQMAAVNLVNDTRAFLEDLFRNFTQKFASCLAEDLKFTVTGTTPISGQYLGKPAYMENVLNPLFSRIEGTFPTPTVENILVDSKSTDNERQLWCAVHFRTENVFGKNGTDFSMRYCWLIKVEDAKTIKEVVGFYDSAKVTALFK